VTIVETSNIDAKVGMVGRGVMEAVSVGEGTNVCVAVGSGDGVNVFETESGVCVERGGVPAHAERKNIPMSSAFGIRFIIILPELGLLLKRKLVYWSSSFP
jgi:hypothetical protein